jgi:hypothetical protein
MQSYVSALDLKLGWRALIKHPVLNLVAGVAIAYEEVHPRAAAYVRAHPEEFVA